MTPEQIKSLQDFVSSLKSEVLQKQLLITGAETLLKIATEGYQTDQSFIDAEVQKGKDAVAEQVSTLVSENASLIEERAALQDKVDVLSALAVITPEEKVVSEVPVESESIAS